MKIFTIAILTLFFAFPAWAGSAETTTLSNGCYEFKLCDAIAADGDCDYASFLPGYSHTLYAETSTAVGFTCTMRSARAYSSTVYGTTSPAITVTDTVEIQPFDALLYTYWLNCVDADWDSKQVTVYDYACPLTK